MQKFLIYNMTGAQPYDKSQILKPVKNCNGFIATNTGNTTVEVNGHILYPGTVGTSNGDAFTFGGNSGEIFLGTIKFSFGPGTNPQVTINQKYYTEEN